MSLARPFEGINIVDASSICPRPQLPSPFGRGLGEGLTLEALLPVTLREMISLLERTLRVGFVPMRVITDSLVFAPLSKSHPASTDFLDTSSQSGRLSR